MYLNVHLCCQSLYLSYERALKPMKMSVSWVCQASPSKAKWVSEEERIEKKIFSYLFLFCYPIFPTIYLLLDEFAYQDVRQPR